MDLAETVTFGGLLGIPGGGLGRDRAAQLRGDGAGLGALAARAGARRLVLQGGAPVVVGPTEAPRLLRLALGDLDPEARGEGTAFLGLDEGGAEGVWVEEAGEGAPLPEGARTDDLRALAPHLPPAEAEMAATGRALLGWQAGHRFCSRCGAASLPAQAGWQRTCPACGAHHFPRTDPVVIMLVERGGRVLLGRSPGWPEGMHSLLAGFIEPGETVEAAVRREVAEETGVRVGRVGYLASQPWPFPASLMLGCRGEGLSEKIEVDPQEVESALWVSRERLLRAFAGEDAAIRAPRRGSIAAFILREWLADRLD
jgi:NAD+ diphosphatase